MDYTSKILEAIDIDHDSDRFPLSQKQRGKSKYTSSFLMYSHCKKTLYMEGMEINFPYSLLNSEFDFIDGQFRTKKRPEPLKWLANPLFMDFHYVIAALK